MEDERKYEILNRHYLRCATKYVEKFTTLRLLDFESAGSIWLELFYKAFEKINSYEATPNFTKQCGADLHENIMWVLDHLTMLQDETCYLMPVKHHCYLANVEIDSMANTLNELWEPGLNITIANKASKKLIHIFEAEYEYQLYIVDM